MFDRKQAPWGAIAVCAAGCLGAWPAGAADGLRGANAAAMGGAALAHPEDNAAIAANPAMLALAQRYDLAGTFSVDHALDLGWHLSAMDSSRGRIGFGAAWERTVSEPPLSPDEMPGWVVPGETPSNLRKTSVFHAGFGVALDEDRRWSLGLGGQFGQVNHDRLGPSLTGDVDLGLGWHPSEPVTVGLVGQGLLPVGGALATPAAVLVGSRYAIEEGPSVALDLGWQLEDASGLGLLIRGGAEAAIGMARPRLGVRYEGPARRTTLSGGIGAENEVGAVEYAVLVPVGGAFSVRAIQHLLTVRIRT